MTFYGQYDGALRDLVLRLKFDGELGIARLFADFLIQAAACLPRPELIIPVPQYPKHLRRRGYNQANEIAGALASLAKLKLSRKLLIRKKPGIPQENLNALERRENLRGAFQAVRELPPEQTIWLVDDVITTGSTCLEAAGTLLAAGAKNIYVLAIARTVLD